MHEDLELRRWLRNLHLLGERGEVKVIDVRDGCQGDKLLEGDDWILDRAQVQNADRLGEEAARELHEPDEEGVGWTAEVEGMVRRVLHHDQALPHVALHDQVHYDDKDQARH